jgi:hypothetical protein
VERLERSARFDRRIRAGVLVAIYYSVTAMSEVGAGVVARFGIAAAVFTSAALTMLQAVDGVALK